MAPRVGSWYSAGTRAAEADSPAAGGRRWGHMSEPELSNGVVGAMAWLSWTVPWVGVAAPAAAVRAGLSAAPGSRQAP